MKIKTTMWLITLVLNQSLLATDHTGNTISLEQLESRENRMNSLEHRDAVFAALSRGSRLMQLIGSKEGLQEDYLFWLRTLIDNSCTVTQFLDVYPRARAFGPELQHLTPEDQASEYQSSVERLSTFTQRAKEFGHTIEEVKRGQEEEIDSFVIKFPVMVESANSVPINQDQSTGEELTATRTLHRSYNNLLTKRAMPSETDDSVELAPKRPLREYNRALVASIAQAYSAQEYPQISVFARHCKQSLRVKCKFELFQLMKQAQKEGLLIPRYGDFLFEDYEKSKAFHLAEMIANKLPMEHFIAFLPIEEQQEKRVISNVWKMFHSNLSKAPWNTLQNEWEYLKTRNAGADMTSRGRQVVGFVNDWVEDRYQSKETIAAALSVTSRQFYAMFLESSYSRTVEGKRPLNPSVFARDLKKLRDTGVLGVNSISEMARYFIQHRVKFGY